MARFGTASLRQSPACRFAARLALLFFALRVVMPAGYMPELGALKHGQVRIVICTGSGTQALLVDESGQPVGDAAGRSGPHAAAGDCAFGIATVQALALPAAPATIARPAFAAALPAAGEGRALRPLAQGSPLGPRAPPPDLG
jgi:Protein of unknown function (DUF2946)